MRKKTQLKEVLDNLRRLSILHDSIEEKEGSKVFVHVWDDAGEIEFIMVFHKFTGELMDLIDNSHK